MSVPLKRVNLMLDEALHEKLKEVAEDRGTSVSELVRTLLARELGMAAPLDELAARIKARREALPAMSDSTEIVRRSRDRGWK